ncbi:hypothetical protein DYB32_007240 [Aphanomyces invadans]|uniref:BTB domain-containing protein n=1 Tax=Aphanomyces invadans TaxID=157072 RepID=A0A418AQ55_9STRA|nr:hypothetical protein DYB32_007240 [Aphanomyces invadans]
MAVRWAAAAQTSGANNDSTRRMDVVRLLLAAGASPLVVNLDGHTPLYESVQACHSSLALAQDLLVYGYPANTNGSPITLPPTRSVFYQAVCAGHAGAVQLLMPVIPPSEWVVVDKEHGDSLLHAAVRHGHAHRRSDMLNVLLHSSKHKGYQLHAAENTALLTPLFLAINLGDDAAVAGLLSHGGYPNERNRQHHSALFTALQARQLACARELIEFGCTLDRDCVAYMRANTPVALPPVVAAPSMVTSVRPVDMQRIECTVERKVDYIHTCVLIAHCPSIRAQLCGPWAHFAPDKAVPVALDTTIASWDYLKAYLYDGGASKLLGSAVCTNQGELDVVVELLMLANSLLLMDVQHLCHAILEQSLPRRQFRDLIASLGVEEATDGAVASMSYKDVAAQAIRTWRHDRRQLLTNKWLADATLIADHSKASHHRCHRAVVGAASPILRSRFECDQRSTATFSLPFSSDVVEAVLEYIYTHALANAAEYSVDFVVEIVQASKAVDVAGCVVLCERELVRRVVQTGCDVALLAVAESLQLEHLVRACRWHLLGSMPTDKAVLLACLAPNLNVSG